MKRPWSLIDIRSLDGTCTQEVPGVGWVPARPFRYHGLWNDLKLAWWVLRRRAEAVVWPEPRPPIVVECCATCEQPKSRINVAGEEREKGWPVCINPDCPAFGEANASACYRLRPAPSEGTESEVDDG